MTASTDFPEHEKLAVSEMERLRRHVLLVNELSGLLSWIATQNPSVVQIAERLNNRVQELASEAGAP